MPTTNIDNRVSRMVELTSEEVELLANDGIITEDDLSYLTYDDIDDDISIVKRRKLEFIIKFLNIEGTELTAKTTMAEVRNVVKFDEFSPTTSSVNGGGTVDVDRGAPKVYTDPLPTFSGNPVDYEEWERKAGATIRQTVYKRYLDRSAIKGNFVEEARSAELYNMILSCVGIGHALNTVEKVKDENNGIECGCMAWKSLKERYLDDSQKSQMIGFYEKKLENLVLDVDTTATEYIDSFEMWVRKLEKLEGHDWSDDKKVREFKNNVIDEDYDTECRVHSGTFQELIKDIRKRETILNNKSNKVANKRQRRFKKDDDDDTAMETDKGTGSNPKAKYKIPFVPNFLYISLDTAGRRTLTNWRAITNAGGTMTFDDLRVDNQDRKRDQNQASKDTSSKKDAKKSKKTRRVTKAVNFNSVNDVVEF